MKKTLPILSFIIFQKFKFLSFFVQFLSHSFFHSLFVFWYGKGHKLVHSDIQHTHIPFPSSIISFSNTDFLKLHYSLIPIPYKLWMYRSKSQYYISAISSKQVVIMELLLLIWINNSRKKNKFVCFLLFTYHGRSTTRTRIQEIYSIWQTSTNDCFIHLWLWKKHEIVPHNNQQCHLVYCLSNAPIGLVSMTNSLHWSEQNQKNSIKCLSSVSS